MNISRIKRRGRKGKKSRTHGAKVRGKNGDQTFTHAEKSIRLPQEDMHGRKWFGVISMRLWKRITDYLRATALKNV
jgi:hypothetical protein